MSTTQDSLEDDAGVAITFVAAIEGYGVLLTSGAPSAVLTAWASTDWVEAVGGMSISGNMGQALDPWRPFGEPSTIAVTVVGCPGQTAGDDRFGQDVWNRTGGKETPLDATIAATATTLVGKSNASFSSSGTVYVGNEAMGVDSKNGSTGFNLLSRGKWSPFTVDGGQPFAYTHRVYQQGSNVDGVRVPPDITSVPRAFVGRWIGIWIHRRLGSTLDTKEEAYLAWAGRIREIEENEDGATVLTCIDLRQTINDTVLMRDQYAGRVAEGIFLPAGTAFTLSTTRGADGLDATPLVVVPSGASGSYQINEGVYPVEDIASILNTWMSVAKTTAESKFFVTYAAYVTTNDGLRPKLTLVDAAAATTLREAELSVSNYYVAKHLGWGTSGSNSIKIHKWGTESATYEKYGPTAPMRVMLMQQSAWGTGAALLTIYVEKPRGTWIDQSDVLPYAILGLGSYEGVLQVAGSGLGYVAAIQTSPTTFTYAPMSNQYSPGGDQPVDLTKIGYTVEETGDLEVSQVLIAEADFTSILRKFISSTGNSGFNNTYDTLDEQLGCGIPHSLIDQLVDKDLLGLDGAAMFTTVVIDKPTKFIEQFAADFIVRKSFLIWKDGQLRLTTWQTPTVDYSVCELNESNKASPVSQRDRMRSSQYESDAWMRNIVKLSYGRRTDGTYAYNRTLIDSASTTRYGDKPVTLELRNVSTALSALIIDGFVSLFAEWMPVLSRPITRVRRTIARTLFTQAIAGAQVTITDEHLRDWSTGVRGLSAEPGLVVSHWYSWGGSTYGADGAPQATAPAGEVEMLIYPTNLAVYAPTAMVDYTAGGAGYNSGSSTLTTFAHKYSESSEAVDSSRFAANDVIRITEIDPSNPSSALSWQRTIQSVGTNSIVLTSGLSSPSFDTSKRYRITFTEYTSTQTSQKTKAYQADETDGLIQDTATGFEWLVIPHGQSTIAYSSSQPTVLPARYADQNVGDGVALDTGSEFEIARLANNMVSYKTAVQTPRIFSSARTWSAGGTWLLVDSSYFFVGPGTFAGARYTRQLYVAPQLKVSSGTGHVRVTLSAGPPFSSTIGSRHDVQFPLGSKQVTFTTTSTSYETSTTLGLDIRHLSLYAGFGFLSVEIDANVSCLGLSVCFVGALEEY